MGSLSFFMPFAGFLDALGSTAQIPHLLIGCGALVQINVSPPLPEASMVFQHARELDRDKQPLS